MKNSMFVAWRDLKIFYKSPGAYLLIFFFLVTSSLWFYEINNFLAVNRADFGNYFALFPYLFIVVIPAISMGSIAGERQNGTLDVLFSLPVTVSELVLGKYTALLVEISTLILLTFPVPLSLVHLGSFDTGQILGEYIGIFLLAAAFAAVSFLVSSFSRTQILAYILSVLIFFLLVVPGILFQFSPVLQYISPANHFTAFAKGILDTRDIFYFLGTVFLFLFLSRERLLLERWT